MPEYKRKKIHTSRRRPKKPEVNTPMDDIPVYKSNKRKPDITHDDSIRVVRGKKGERRKKFYAACAFIVSVALLLAILSFTLPVGVIESARNLILPLGAGSYPADLSGGAVVNCVPKDNYYYVLTDTSIMAFSNGGKKIFSYVHGFTSPIIATSQTRAILFDQGKNTAVIYNLFGVVDRIESKDPIITADISKNGEYALVTKSDSYASCVKVYNRRGKSVYSINFAKDIVNNVDIASSGKKIAVSTLNAEGGKIVSSVRVYSFNSANPDFKLDLDEDMVYDIENTGSGFLVTTHNKTRYIKWFKYTVSENSYDGEIASVRYSDSGIMLVYNRTNDKSDNQAVLFTNSGKKISEFKIKDVIHDIRFSRGRVYVMSDNKITILDKHGEVLRSDSCSFGGVRLAVIGANTVCILSDSDIQKAVIKEGV